MARSPNRTDIDLRDVNERHTLAILSVRPGSRVLEVNIDDTPMTPALRQRGCSVWSLQADKSAADEAQESAEQVVVGDVEEVDLSEVFGGLEFDHVVCLDALRHVRHPVEALQRLATLLAPDGRLVTSAPNPAYGALRLQLLAGRFSDAVGPNDDGQLRLLDPDLLDKLFTDAGLTVLDRLRVVKPLRATTGADQLGSFPPEVIDEVRSHPEADTSEFVLIAAAAQTAEAPADASESLAERLQATALEAEASVRSLERVLADRMAELERLHLELRHSKLDVVVKDEYIAELRRSVEEAPAAVATRRARYYVARALTRVPPAERLARQLVRRYPSLRG